MFLELTELCGCSVHENGLVISFLTQQSEESLRVAQGIGGDVMRPFREELTPSTIQATC